MKENINLLSQIKELMDNGFSKQDISNMVRMAPDIFTISEKEIEILLEIIRLLDEFSNKRKEKNEIKDNIEKTEKTEKIEKIEKIDEQSNPTFEVSNEYSQPNNLAFEKPKYENIDDAFNVGFGDEDPLFDKIETHKHNL